MTLDAAIVGERVRAANHLLESGGNENTMAPHLLEGLSKVLPSGVEPTFDWTREGSGDRPDFTVTRDSAAIAYIEVKRPNTLSDAFTIDKEGTYQVDRYRSDGLPVLLTDGLRWYDVTDPERWNPKTFTLRLQSPFATFIDASLDEQSALSLSTLFQAALKVKPRYTAANRPTAMLTVINRINSAHNDYLDGAWEAAKQYLRASSTPDELGDGRVGELIAFTLLAVAASLQPLSDQEFVPLAQEEWRQNRTWKSAELPPALASALNDFRRVDGESGDSLLGGLGWVIIRSVASSLSDAGAVDWDALSALWDNYLALAGQRAQLGSWQTPPPIARFQATQVSEALRTLGYQGFNDPAVTTIDPCCGTGVYLQEVIKQTEREGGTAASLSTSDGLPARIIGSDISPTAVAATHIRVSSLGVSPNLYMADTLSSSPERGSVTGRIDASEMLGLFTFEKEGFDAALVHAVKRDHQELSAWAGRSAERDPVVAVIGNPPYGRSGLTPGNYEDRGWYVEVFDRWRKGSGGRGSLQDPFVAFMAWAFRLCQLPHDSISDESPYGVVSFIANRSWVDGKTFSPFRKWLREQAALVLISDFGPGSRGDVGNRWSEQPFAIETGTAIMTVIFNPTADERSVVKYQRAYWTDGEVNIQDEAIEVAHDSDWTGQPDSMSLFVDGHWMNGVKTGTDKEWITTKGDRAFGTRHAYRAFDNRYSPTSAPVPPKPGELSKSHHSTIYARWNLERLFTPHQNPTTRPDWYLIGQSTSVKPGPALHATKNLPDYHLFKGSEGGKVLPISAQTPIPREYADVEKQFKLDSSDFWLLTLAVAHHHDYWMKDTDLAQQLADDAVEPPYPSDHTIVPRLVEIGRELVSLWTVDEVKPIPFSGTPGSWKFESHNDIEAIAINGRKVLYEWRRARSGDWDRRTATEYARTIAAVRRTVDLSEEVKKLLR